MSKVNSIVKLTNHVSREAFDLSNKNLYTAKIGELLPVQCIEIIPGDKAKIKVQNLTRTVPVNTAAYTRIREYYDWYFVPTNLLWNKFNTWVTNMTNNNQQAISVSENTVGTAMQPYINSLDIYNYLQDLSSNNAAGKPINLNQFGFNRAALSCKLLNYLDYGHWQYLSEDDGFGNVLSCPYNNALGTGYSLNPFPLLAYQKIYYDHFRNSQWEDSFAPAFNVNYIGNTASARIPVEDIPLTSPSMFDMHYCNWQKDYFMGLLPEAQYGDTATITNMPEYEMTSSEFKGGLIKTYMPYFTNREGAVGTDYFDNAKGIATDIMQAQYLSGSVGFDEVQAYELSRMNVSFNKADLYLLSKSLGLENFTVLALRQAEALQKYREITQSQAQDYKSQIKAHWDVNVSNAYSDLSTYIGGSVNSLDINEQANTNLTGDNVANIQGKGIGAGQGEIEFSSDVHGYLMCVYHAIPLLDYAACGISKRNLKVFPTDYAIPEFDATGMVEVPMVELWAEAFDTNSVSNSDPLGYSTRYYDYKMAFDKVRGGFIDSYTTGDEDFENGFYSAWVAPIDRNYLMKWFEGYRSNKHTAFNADFLRVNPSIMNSIFVQAAGSDTNTDQLLVNCSFDIKMVRNLDRNGLPY